MEEGSAFDLSILHSGSRPNELSKL